MKTFLNPKVFGEDLYRDRNPLEECNEIRMCVVVAKKSCQWLSWCVHYTIIGIVSNKVLRVFHSEGSYF